MMVKKPNHKTEILAFRVTARMEKRILAAATAEGMTKPDWIRYVVSRAVENVEQETA